MSESLSERSAVAAPEARSEGTERTARVPGSITLLYAAAIFVGAFLLFVVQPLIGKYVLPWFGGTPAVWSTCMLFFQILLLAGYAYAHLSTRFLPSRAQAVLHLLFLAIALAMLPIAPSESLKPGPDANPAMHLLFLLGACLGLPYLVLSATSPLLQAWYGSLGTAGSPYRFYALSNAGSLLALISYPFLIEPTWTRYQQSSLWSWSLGLFALLCGLCAVLILVRRHRSMGSRTPTPSAAHESAATKEVVLPPPLAAAAGSLADSADPAKRTLGGRVFLWVALPAAASALLLATTNKLCQDVAVVPFLWVAPLSLYLASFIICFDHPRWYRRSVFVPLMLAGVVAAYGALVWRFNLSIYVQVLIYCGVLWLCCMVCHGEVYRLRPEPRRLTAFYLSLSSGGALGGAFVALLAPVLFRTYLEFQLSLLACCLLAWFALFSDSSRAHRVPAYRLAALVPVLLAAGFLAAEIGLMRRTIAMNGRILGHWRNFYGVLTLHEDASRGETWKYLRLDHGGIRHGIQFADPSKRRWPTTYYGPTSGVGLLLNVDTSRPRTIGVVGLGVGTLATYGKAQDHIVFYEINPLVKELAETRFTYLADSPARSEIVLGDARLSLEHESYRGFDVLVLDAFSGDAIPVHLLTREAFDVYERHMAHDGVIAVHVSNLHLRLRPVVEKVAQSRGLSTAFIHDGAAPPVTDESTWVLASRVPGSLQTHAILEVARRPLDLSRTRLWTDEDSNLFEILKPQQP